jgi:gliding motility-associated-like protein
LQNGVTDGILKIGVNTNGMQQGIYYGSITIKSPQSTADPIIVSATLVINPDVPVNLTTWKDGYSSAMSLSVDDGQPSGFDELQSNGFSGTYLYIGTVPPSFFTSYYNAGMELGSHTVNHHCAEVTDDNLRTQEFEPNILGMCSNTPEPCSDVITLAWPCGYTSYHEQAVATEYFLSARGYNINQLEDATPDNFMNLKSYNSHEHTPYPPADLKTVVDDAIAQKKWFNLVLHNLNNDDGAFTYAHSKDIWVNSIGTIIKYILQRDRFILTNYSETTNEVTFNVSRLPIPSSVSKNFEAAFHSTDVSTVQIDIDDSRTVQQVLINGAVSSYQIKDLSGNKVLLADVRLDPSGAKSIEVDYQSISPYTLIISGVTVNNKVYDGTTAATLNTGSAKLVGVLGGDVVNLVTSGATGTFVNKNAGTGKMVTTSGFSLGGTDAGKYSLTQPTSNANITTANLTVRGVSANNRVYNSTIETTLNKGSAVLVGAIAGDVVSLISTSATGNFVNKNVGTSKLVSTSGFTLGGTDAGNYNLTQPTTTANITTAGLTITGMTANNKVYNGTTSTTLNTGSAVLVGVIGGDVVSLVSTGATGTFSNKNAGTVKSVSTSGFTLGGTDAGNYNLTQPTTTANITTAGLTITGMTANNKVYNGTTSATLNTGSAVLAGVIGGDVVSLISTGATGTFSNKNAGIGKSVSTSGFTLGGTDAGNYIATQPLSFANITTASLNVSGVTAISKIYDGTTKVTLNTGSAKLVGVFGTDDVYLNSTGASGSFLNKNAGTGKTVSTSGFTIGGTDSGNYNLAQPSTMANITTASLTISGVTANNKAYNGTIATTLNTGGTVLVGVFGGDIVNLVSTGATGTFANKNVGTGKLVLTSGFTLGGPDAGNYTITYPSSLADITSAGLTVSGIIANNKVYDGTTTATLNAVNASLVGVFGTDNVTLNITGATGTFTDKNAGIGKSVSISGLTLGGTDGGNYKLTQPSMTSSISPKTLIVIAKDLVKQYRATLIFTGTEFTTEGLVPGDTEPGVKLNSPGASASADVGKYVITIEGGSDSNYSYTYVSAMLTVNKSKLIVTADDKVKTYGSDNPPLTISYTGFALGQDQSILDALPGVETDANSNSDVGDYDIQVSGAADSNYYFIYNKGTLKVNKADQVITFDKMPNGLRMTQDYHLNATASSGLDVSFELSDSNIGILNGNVLAVRKDGNMTITAKQEGDHNWNPAPDAMQSIVTLPTFDNISSLFTPNNDGMNDYWYIPNLEQYGNLKVTVYNRFGQVVYQSDSYKNDWDGTWNGYPLPSASYYYIIKSSSKGFIKGVVNIVR